MALHQQLFSHALGVDAAPPVARHEGICERALAPAVAACLAALVILVVRPPFALLVEYDQRRPWAAEARLSWPAVGVSAALAAGLAVGLPLLLQRQV